MGYSGIISKLLPHIVAPCKLHGSFSKLVLKAESKEKMKDFLIGIQGKLTEPIERNCCHEKKTGKGNLKGIFLTCLVKQVLHRTVHANGKGWRYA